MYQHIHSLTPAPVTCFDRSDTVASKYLKAAKWNVESAVNAYFDSPPEPSSRGSSKASSASSSFDIAAATEWFDKYRGALIRSPFALALVDE